MALEGGAHRHLARDLAAIGAVALALMLFWLGSTHPQFNKDSLQYLDGARKLVWQPHTDFIMPNRPPGYSLLMVLTGVTWLESFRWLIGVQAALGLAIPPLIYLTLLPLGRAPALGAGLAGALVPIPYICAGMVMSEQLALFLQFVFLFLASRYLAPARPPRFLYLATLVAFAMVLTRPKDALVFWVFLPLAALAPPRRVREPLLAGALYCALLVTWSAADWLCLGYGDTPAAGESAAAHRATERFREAYLHTWVRTFEDYREPRPLIVPENGPASRELYGHVAQVMREKPDSWKFRPPLFWFGAYRSDPDALLREFFTRPNPEYLDYVVGAVGSRIGSEAGGRLLAAVARECGIGGWRGFVASLSPGVPSRLEGSSLLWEAAIAGRHHGGYDPDRSFPIVRPQNGPATRQLYRAAADYGEASGEPGRAVAVALLENPGPLTYPLMTTAAMRLYGAAGADRLLRDVALEAFRAYPAAALVIWDNFVMLAAGPSEVQYTAGKRGTDLPGPLFLSSGLDRLPEKMRREVDGAKPATPFFDALYRGAHLLRPLLLVACLVLLPFAWAGPARPLAVLLVLLALSQYAVVAAMSQPHGRFTDPAYLLLVMTLAIGAAGARARSKERP
ncbi:MAG TPA: hypothetical protein VI078_00775 [bacterium]